MEQKMRRGLGSSGFNKLKGCNERALNEQSNFE